jgi:hypothetical protein
MSLATTFNAIFNPGIGMSLFTRKDRHNLYEHTPRHNDEEENNSTWGGVEEVGDNGINWNDLEKIANDDTNGEEAADNGVNGDEEADNDANQNEMADYQSDTSNKFPVARKRRMRIPLLVTGIVLIMLLLTLWLVIFPVKNLQNYPQIDGNGLNMQLQVKNTGSVIPAYDVTFQSPASSKLHLLKGDTLNVTWNIFQFPGSAPRLKLIDVASQFANPQQEQNIKVDPLNSGFQFTDSDGGYFNSWMRSPLMSISTGSCSVPLGEITDLNTYNLTITATPAGKCSYVYVQQK